ncbi:emp24/gp25L/p24 family protein (macronuclear) [Tetrahymena thermophila SB210]|uniref:Emp24/gp25L/p24 family protein n=1 Tax=Tetrahymena thermophila (strain SB210) TaxID=312017 RepID=A4VDT8_TETTS|nr:emp24/gp25L/p24 family protein [Tetrahymena thermophila SB210]EDK31687.2 emp24/gp25L/p24 family protein [Tetrahymena thermophila SB210]|eukprot:XP_001470815.2 emp24/gp25L/p24 family protein [Tetrahymena thermophila SB210]
MKFSQFVLLTTLVFSCSYALDININGRDIYCLYQQLFQNEHLVVRYEVSGYKPDQFRFSVYEDFSDTSKQPLYEVYNQKSHIYNLTATKQHEYKVCFQSLDNSGKILQFELNRINNSADDSYADDKKLQQAYNESVQAYYTLNDIYTNMRHTLLRLEVQDKILESTESKVKWCSIIKMILMISITTIQIVFLTGLFKDSSYQGI